MIKWLRGLEWRELQSASQSSKCRLGSSLWAGWHSGIRKHQPCSVAMSVSPRNSRSQAVEGRKEFVIVHRRGYIAIPKRVFQGESQIEGFRNLLKSKLPKFGQKFRIWLDFQR